MNLLDWIVVALVVAAAFGGSRIGFLANLLSWAGLAFGIGIAVAVLPSVIRQLNAESSDVRLLAALCIVFGAAAIGQGIGLAIGGLLRVLGPSGGSAKVFDRAAGALIGTVGVLVGVWLLTPAVASAPGWPAREARSSKIVRALHRVTPSPPDSIESLGRMISEAPFPQVLGDLEGPPAAGLPPALNMDPTVNAAVRAAMVKVEGQACDRIQDGSGFVVERGVVVTNAHVVAGERSTTVTTSGGDRLKATVVVFDPKRDLALLRVAKLVTTPLQLRSGRRGTVGAVYGYPGGGKLQAAPARIAEEIVAVGSDIYRTADTRRRVLVLAADLAPGDSGGPFVDQEGRVAGVAFAIDPARASTSYALSNQELAPLLRDIGDRAVNTGTCLIG